MSAPQSILSASVFILITCFTGELKPQGQIKQPMINANTKVVYETGSVNIVCQGTYQNRKFTCRLYRNTEQNPFKEAQSDGNSCEFLVSGGDLLVETTPIAQYRTVTLRCDYMLSKLSNPSEQSDSVTFEVYKVRIPKISVYRNKTDLLIRCEAPSNLTGLRFSLFHNESRDAIEERLGAVGETAVIFSVPYSTGSNFTYCCRYQYELVYSKMSDCIGPEPDSHEVDFLVLGVTSAVGVFLLGVTAVCLYRHYKKAEPGRQPSAQVNDSVDLAMSLPEGNLKNDMAVSDVTYCKIHHQDSSSSKPPQQIQENVVYSSVVQTH